MVMSATMIMMRETMTMTIITDLVNIGRDNDIVVVKLSPKRDPHLRATDIDYNPHEEYHKEYHEKYHMEYHKGNHQKHKWYHLLHCIFSLQILIVPTKSIWLKLAKYSIKLTKYLLEEDQTQMMRYLTVRDQLTKYLGYFIIL